ncbi:SpoIIE family protein phosphatase [Ignavibacterium album]|nr:CHASE2 domain-containing protein [Ignavibacterium album]
MSFDYLVYDFLLSRIYKQNKSQKIQYLLITNKTYSNLFRSNRIDRSKIAEAVTLLEEFGVELIIFDIIFVYPSNSKDDNSLAKVLQKYKNIIQPIGVLNYQEINSNQDFQKNISIDLQPHLKLLSLDEIIFPYPSFLSENSYLGQISDNSDNDGIMRHTRLIIKKDSSILPSLSLTSVLRIFDDSINTVRFISDDLLLINNKIKIPFDNSGRTLIPFLSKWGNDFSAITLEDLMEMAVKDSDKMKLKNSLNGKIIVVADVSASAADIFPTPFSKLTPLVMLHTSVLNALLNNKFIHKTNFFDNLLILNFFLIISFSLFFKQKRIYFFISFLCSLLILSIFNVLIFMLGYFLFYVSVLLCLLISYTLGFIIVEFIFIKEKKIIELDNIRKSFEMNETNKILQNLLPPFDTYFNDYEISAYYSTAEEVGGDFYDYYQKNGELKIFIADGSGHGLQAGILVVSLKTIITSLELKNPSETLFHINNILKEIHFSKLFLCISMISLQQGYITFSNAGLPPLLHYNSKMKKIESYIQKNIPLGIKQHFNYIESKIKLEKNDILFIYTDGLSELFNSKKEMLGIEKIQQTLLNHSSKTTGQIVSEFKALISKWKNEYPQNDDITFLVIKKI